jgi:CBS-domain-containing membrane protein
MLARDIMTTHIVSIGPDASVREAARLLSTYHISGAPVVDDDGALVGLVTEADLIGKTGRSVADIMTRRVLTVSDDTAVDTIAQMLTSNGYKRVPILRDGALVGIVSRADIVRMMASRWVCEKCGAVQHGARPTECFSCGADGGAFEREIEPRPELSRRQ